MEISLFTLSLIRHLITELQEQTLSRETHQKCIALLRLLEKEAQHV